MNYESRKNDLTVAVLGREPFSQNGWLSALLSKFYLALWSVDRDEPMDTHVLAPQGARSVVF